MQWGRRYSVREHLTQLREAFARTKSKPLGIHHFHVITYVDCAASLVSCADSVADQRYPPDLVNHIVAPRTTPGHSQALIEAANHAPLGAIVLDLPASRRLRDPQILDTLNRLYSSDEVWIVPRRDGVCSFRAELVSRLLVLQADTRPSSLPMDVDRLDSVLEAAANGRVAAPPRALTVSIGTEQAPGVHPGTFHVPPPRRPKPQPLISVVMPAYNEERYIESAIQSVLDQTHRELELIVVDDGSSDRTPEVLDDMRKREARLRVITQANRGIVAALNTGCAAASGSYLARMDANDLIRPQRLAVQLRYLNRFEDVGVVATHMEKMDETGRSLGEFWRTPTLPSEVAWGLHFGSCIVHASILCRRRIMEEAGFYRSEGVMHAEDYDLWARLISRTRMASLPTALFLRRELPCGITSTQRNAQNVAKLRIMRRLITHLTERAVEDTDLDVLSRLHRRQTLSPARIESAFKMLMMMHACFVNRYPMCPAEEDLLSFDAARKVILLAAEARRTAPALSARLLARAVKDSPLRLPMKAAQTSMARLRPWANTLN